MVCKPFCILPFIHMHILPDSRVVPCCMGDFNDPLGFLSDKSPDEIFNSTTMKNMRILLKQGKPPRECRRCVEIERDGGETLRQQIWKKLSSAANTADEMLPDGTMPRLSMKYLDVRFSNLCNFRCRTCDSYLSSSWYADETLLLGKPPEYGGMHSLAALVPDFSSMIESWVKDVEIAYLAGGEPLLSEENYWLLELLADHNPDCRIEFNTNLSTLSLAGKDILPIVRRFRDVTFFTSADDMGERLELIRKGSSWNNFIKNLRRVREELPDAKVILLTMASALSIWNLCSMHKHLVEKDLIGVDDIHVMIVLFPPHYRVNIFPEKDLIKIQQTYDRHLSWLSSNGAKEQTKNEFQLVKNALGSRFDDGEMLESFVKVTRKLDKIRDEDTAEIIPELKSFLVQA